MWPPTTIGTLPPTGFGFDSARSNEQKRPWNVGSSEPHSSRRAATYSSVRAPRSAKGTPIASNSSSSQPTPMPSRTLPPVSWSSVATSLASTSGLRCGRIRMPVPSSTRSECAPSHVNQMSGSGMGDCSPPGMRPLLRYGYVDS